MTSTGNSLSSAATVSAGGTETFLPGALNETFLSQQFANALNNIDRAIENIIDVQTRVGGRMNSIDSQITENEGRELQLQQTRSDIEDLDFAEAISQLNFQSTALQAAQQSYVKIQGLSLFDFI